MRVPFSYDIHTLAHTFFLACCCLCICCNMTMTTDNRQCVYIFHWIFWFRLPSTSPLPLPCVIQVENTCTHTFIHIDRIVILYTIHVRVHCRPNNHEHFWYAQKKSNEIWWKSPNWSYFSIGWENRKKNDFKNCNFSWLFMFYEVPQWFVRKKIRP